MKKLVIFDLDGTLLNTIADLAQGVNYALEQEGFKTFSDEEYKAMVGNGVTALFQRALEELNENSPENVERIRGHFLPFYNLHNAEKSTPYSGVVELLERLKESGVAMAVASNKYQAATAKLVKHYFPTIDFVAVFGQREGVAIKPDPTIIYDVLEVAKIAKEDVLYVGDSGVDMQTAINGGVEVCGVDWGFRSRAELESFSPNHIVSDCDAIASIVLG